MTNGLKIGMYQVTGISGRPELQQRLVMTPPIAQSEADLEAVAVYSHTTRVVTPEVLAAVRSYIVTENSPSSDADIAKVLGEEHPNIDRSTVSTARQNLGIAPSVRRRSGL